MDVRQNDARPCRIDVKQSSNLTPYKEWSISKLVELTIIFNDKMAKS